MSSLAASSDGAGSPPRSVPLGFILLMLFGAVVVSSVIAVGLGAVAIPTGTVWRIVTAELGVTPADVDWTKAQRAIVWELRAPRVLLGAAAGAGLASIGAVLQVLTRNPLADPYLFGISSGAAFGAVAVILHAGAWAGPLGLPAAAFLGALVAMVFVFAAAGAGREIVAERLVLTGVAVAFILHAGTNFLIFNAFDRGADAAIFWMLGGLSNARWSLIPVPIGLTLCGIAWLAVRAPIINALSLGDETARSIGVDPFRLRTELFVVTAMMTGAIVSACGSIGFVGLVLPHAVRLTIGGDLRRLLPTVALVGAIFLVWVDVVARLALAPRELPLGVVTSMIGGVFFLWLIRRRM